MKDLSRQDMDDRLELSQYLYEMPGESYNNITYFEPESLGYFPMPQYYFDKFGHFGNYIATYSSITQKDLENFLSTNGYTNIWVRKYPASKIKTILTNQEIFVKGSVMMLLVHDYKSEMDEEGKFCETEERLSTSFKILYKDWSDIEPLLSIVKDNPTVEEAPQGCINLIVRNSQGGLSTKSFNTKIEDFDVALHYGDSFKSVYDHILDKLNTNLGKGIVLLHGAPGCGKTSLVKLLTKHIKRKDVIFCPPYMVEAIGSPEFIPFLLQNPNSILVIEDAERVLLSRDSGESSSQGVSSLLNLSDGVLADCLNIQVIATFNTSKNNIDKALLRKGRLIGEYHFGPLSVEDSNRLLEHLGKTARVTTPSTLADIYGIDEVEIKSKEEKPTIGFNR